VDENMSEVSLLSKLYLPLLVLSLAANLLLALVMARKEVAKRWFSPSKWKANLQSSYQKLIALIQPFALRQADVTAKLQNYLARLNYGILALGIGIYLVAIYTGLWLAMHYFEWVGNPIPGILGDIVQWQPIWVSLAVLVGGWVVAGSPRWSPRFWQFVGGAVALFILYSLIQKPFTIQFYGDYNSLENFLQSGVPYPAWLIGNSILGWLLASVWQFPPINQLLPPHLQSISGFVMCASVVSFGLSTVILLKVWPNRLWILYPILSPFWILFGIGYSEYYPFIISPLVALAAFIFTKPLKEHSPLAVGIAVTSIAFLYNAFIPIAILLLVWYAIARPREIIKTAGICAAGTLVVLTVCWPGSFQDYFARLYGNMNWGETNTLFERFQGKSAGPNSIFFSTQYALSAEHLKDVAYFCFWGGVFIFLALVVIGIIWAVWQTIRSRRLLYWLNTNLGLALSTIAFLAYYVIFMIPKLGIPQDVDLFSFAYVLFAFFAGYLWDWLLHDKPYRLSANFFLTAFVLGESLALLVFLAKIGLPSI
jgi:hypothetical protein